MINYLFEFLIFIFFFFIIAQIFKFSFFILYLWQIMEYRLDRLIIRFGNIGDRKEFFSYFNFLNFLPFNKYPKVTFKIILILLFFIFLDYQLVFIIYRPLVRFLAIQDKLLIAFFLVLLAIYYLAPLLISSLVLIFSALTWPVKKIIIIIAENKIKRMKNILVIGITGSFGKSSTKEVVSRVLSLKYKVLRTVVNTNTEIGVAKTIIFKLNKYYQIFVVEMGAYKIGEIKAICDIVRPTIGILTGIDQQHLALFRSMTNTQKAKYELIRSLPKTGIALFNSQNEYCHKLAKKIRRCKVKLYGERSAKYEEVLDLAYLLGKYFSINQNKIKKIIPSLKKMIQIKKIKGKKNITILDDTYNSNPSGFVKALQTINQFKKKKLVITPGIIELGSQSRNIHRQLGMLLAKVADRVIITNENFAKDFAEGAVEQFNSKFLVSNKEEAILSWLKRGLSSKWVILMEGRVVKNIQDLFTKNKQK